MGGKNRRWEGYTGPPPVKRAGGAVVVGWTGIQRKHPELYSTRKTAVNGPVHGWAGRVLFGRGRSFCTNKSANSPLGGGIDEPKVLFWIVTGGFFCHWLHVTLLNFLQDGHQAPFASRKTEELVAPAKTIHT